MVGRMKRSRSVKLRIAVQCPAGRSRSAASWLQVVWARSGTSPEGRCSPVYVEVLEQEEQEVEGSRRCWL